MASDTVWIFSDGSAHPTNPGHMHLGCALFNALGVYVGGISEEAGWGSSNDAEYLSLIAGLKLAQKLGFKKVMVRSDSELLVNQVRGDYAVKKANLKKHHQEVMRLFKTFGKLPADYIDWHSRETDFARIADAASRGQLFKEGETKWEILNQLNQQKSRPPSSSKSSGRIPVDSPTPKTSSSRLATVG